VSVYEKLAKKVGLTWPIPEGVDLDKLLQRPYVKKVIYPDPDWEWVHREKQRKGVTLKLLWDEYQATHEQVYSYTQFTVKFRKWLGIRNLSMRQIHKAGEKLFVDYAGQTVKIDDPKGSYQAQVFVANLGASHYTYIEASKSQTKQD
jgi:transposase